MKTIIEKLKLLFADQNLRRRIFFVIGALVVFRILASIPIPGVDQIRLQQFFASNQFFTLFNVFSGGGFSKLSIVMLGVGPYITASIIMQLLTMMSTRIKQLYHEEGEAGRRKFIQYSRMLTVPLALAQAFGFILLLQQQGLIVNLTSLELAINILIVTAGSIFLMWIGELITEFGIGNGLSLIIFAGIVASLPTTFSQLAFSFTPALIPTYVILAATALVVIYGVIVITEAERPIPVTYAKRVRGNKVFGGVSTYLPLRLNQAGVIPIIFALSILLFPQMIANFLSASINPTLQTIATTLNSFVTNQWIYGSVYFFFVVIFTYFYTAVSFDPGQISQNLQKNGAFIPGVRPGQSTSVHIARILTRLTLVGALFLGIIAVLPLVIQSVTGLQIAIGGTALLIVVSVVIDLIKKIDAQLTMREY